MKHENARESFVFYRSFYEALKDLPADIQLELFSAVMEYALYGIQPDNLSPIARGYMILMKPQIDANNRRFINGCRPKKKGTSNPQPAADETETTAPVEEHQIDNQVDETVPTYSQSTDTLPPDNFEPAPLPESSPEHEHEPEPAAVQSDQTEQPTRPAQPEGLNDDILTDDESARFQLLFPHTHRNREFLFFIKWMKNNVPYCVSPASWSHGITESEYERLRMKYDYSTELIAKTVAEIANRRDLRDKYDNFYLTLLNWLKKSHAAA